MPVNHANLSVAIVDDDQQLVMIYQQLFNYRKITVSFVACDGFVALERFREADPKPSIVLIDYRMPVMNGIELTKELLQLAPGTKIIFISADDSVRQAAIDAGANVFLKKPTSLKEIMESIGSL